MKMQPPTPTLIKSVIYILDRKTFMAKYIFGEMCKIVIFLRIFFAASPTSVKILETPNFESSTYWS